MRRAGWSSAAPARAAWLVQPLYLVAEVGLAVLTGVAYSVRDDTISALGTACDPGGAGCSSAPQAMNVAFVGFGLLQALGALPLLAGQGRSGRRTVVGWLWVVAGLGSVGVGLLPVDTHPTAHSLVAFPVFAAQPVALLLHALLLRPGAARRAGLGLAAVALVGVACFVVLLGHDEWVGLAERAAVWPAKLWLPLAALATATASPGPAAASPRPRPAGPPPGPRPDGTGPVTPPTARGR
ncbi:DUF998 domain-containing protein [Pedococcus bigeumensis]|uniref:DUF998 domain-containing protein n=1 Tax=Pedococcus bigeumensis TaxID=433644 RepID=UPI0031E3C050